MVDPAGRAGLGSGTRTASARMGALLREECAREGRSGIGERGRARFFEYCRSFVLARPPARGRISTMKPNPLTTWKYLAPNPKSASK